MAKGSSLGLLLGVAAVGGGLYFMSTRASAATAAPPPPNPVDYDLGNLSKQNPGLAASVKQALTTPTAPDDLQRLQQAVQFSYPNLGVALGNRLNATTATILTASSDIGYKGTDVPVVTISLDPLGNLHFYTRDFTPILVVKAGPTDPSANLMVTRNASTAFDAIIKHLMSLDLNLLARRIPPS